MIYIPGASMGPSLDRLGKAEKLFQLHSVAIIFGLVFISILLFYILTSSGPPKDLPLINGTRLYKLTNVLARKRYFENGRELIKSGLSKADVFGIITDGGYHVILHPKFADEIHNNPSLNSGKALAKIFHTDIPGFEAFGELHREDGLFGNTVRTRLPKMIWHSTALSDEAAVALQAEWTDDPEWHNITTSHSSAKLIAQVSSRVFLGKATCRDPVWLNIAVNYSLDLFQGAMVLGVVPPMMQKLVAQILPPCRRLRRYLRDSRTIIQAILDQQEVEKEQAIRDGKPPKRHYDAIECFEEAMQGQIYDPVHTQLTLSFAAIHSTSDMLTKVLLDLAERPELIQGLREEIKTALPQGWNKSTVGQLKFMDSVLKESQRLKPVGLVSMRRVTEAPLRLSDGTLIPEGTTIEVASNAQWDEAYYPDPDTFDPYRFLKSSQKTSAQLEATSPHNLSFGLGKHACPGRFFAANQVKVILCHILMKYEIKIVGEKPRSVAFGSMLVADPSATLAIRRRREEVIL